MRALELSFFAILAIGLILGLAASFVAPDLYVDTLSAEDGLFEWATAAFLFLACLVCLKRTRLAGKPLIFNGFLLLDFAFANRE